MATQINNNEKASDLSFDWDFYNKEGVLNKSKLFWYYCFIFLSTFLVVLHFSFFIYSIYEFSYNPFSTLSNFLSFELKVLEVYAISIFVLFKNFVYIVISFIVYLILQSNFTMFSYENLEKLTFISFPISLILSISFIVFLYIRVKEKANIQSALTSIGLNQFFLKKYDKENRQYTFQLRRGEKMDFETWKDKSGNLKQLLNCENLQSERQGTNQILVEISDKMPSVEDLKTLKHEDFLRKNKIFLGIGIKKIGKSVEPKRSKLSKLILKFLTKYKMYKPKKYDILQEDLVLGKYVAIYVDFQIPFMSINGQMGSGKSVFLNGFLKSVFHNFDLVEVMVFVDHKGEVSARAYKDFEAKHKTNKIFTMGEDRLLLLNFLEKIWLIHLARLEYMKAHKTDKIQGHRIIAFFDEMSQVMKFESRNKREMEIHNRTIDLFDSIFRTCRASDIFVGYATQNPFPSHNGVTQTMKTNTSLCSTMLLKTTSEAQSVSENFLENGVDPTKFTIGQFGFQNSQNGYCDTGRALFVGDNFLDNTTIPKDKVKKDMDFDREIKEFYKLVVQREKEKEEALKKLFASEAKNPFKKQEEQQSNYYFDLDILLEDLLNDRIVNYNYMNSKNQKKEEVQQQEIILTQEEQKESEELNKINIEEEDNNIDKESEKQNKRIKNLEDFKNKKINENSLSKNLKEKVKLTQEEQKQIETFKNEIEKSNPSMVDTLNNL